MIKPEVLDAMVAAGCTAEQIAAAVKADQKRSSGAERQARYRARKRNESDERDVTSVTVTPVTPPKEKSPTPPKEITPIMVSEAEASSTNSPEAGRPAPAAVIGLPTVSEGDFPVSQAEVDGWAEAFPGVDVRQQLAAMRQWLIANPTRRKTKRGMRKFVVTWLDRRQNAAPPPARRATAPPQPSKPRNAGEDARQELIRRGLYAPDRTPKLIDQSDGNAGFAGTDIARRIAIATSGGRPT